jgi:hypothetical protein
MGISYFIFKPIFNYVHLNGDKFKQVPFLIVVILLWILLFLEGYLKNVSTEAAEAIMIIFVLTLLGFYYNEKQRLAWNLSILITAVALGFVMEYLGFIAGFWHYPNHHFPIFVGLTWALNAWGACGLAQVFGIDTSRAFPLISKFDESKNVRWKMATLICHEPIRGCDGKVAQSAHPGRTLLTKRRRSNPE